MGLRFQVEQRDMRVVDGNGHYREQHMTTVWKRVRPLMRLAAHPGRLCQLRRRSACRGCSPQSGIGGRTVDDAVVARPAGSAHGADARYDRHLRSPLNRYLLEAAVGLVDK